VREYLTDAFIKKLEPRADRFEVSDTDEAGLRLRVTPIGAKVFSYWFRNSAGRTRRVALGAFPGLSLSAARKRARKLSVTIDGGGDPAGEREAKRAAHRSRKDAAKLSDICDDFIRDQQKNWRPSTRIGWTRWIKADIVPRLGHMIPAEVTTDDVLSFIEGLKKKRGPVSVARCYEVLRRILRWATARRKLRTSPCAGLDARELVAKAETRSRTYSDPEIRAILAAAAGTELRHLLPLIFYTATRSLETRSARWADIDTVGRVWTVPSERSKTGEAHRVPLSSGAMAVLEELKGETYLFPAPTREGYMDAPQKAVETIRKLSNISDFRLHDCRRTTRQRLHDLGVSAEVAEAVLGHLPSRLLRTYAPNYEPLAAMASALEAWSVELGRILRNEEKRPATVLPIGRRA
jgi:integrase